MLENYISLFPKETHFFSDGIINEEKYNTAKERILWILKEPWTKEVHETIKVSDYISYINNFKLDEYPQYDTSTPMWRRITYSNAGILEGGSFYNDLDDLPGSKEVFETLFSRAIINLKKIPGSTKSNYGTIDHYFRIGKDFIFNQIEEINPSIIICGSTFDHLKPHIENELKQINNEPVSNFCIWKNRLLIHAYHPSYMQDYEEYCDYIVNAYNTWRSIK